MYVSTDLSWLSLFSIVLDYKNLSWVWGVHRKIRSEGYCLPAWGLPSDVRLWSWGTDFSVCPSHHGRFFFLHTFHFWKWVFDNAVTSIADVHHILMTIQWHLVTSLHSVISVLTMAYRDILYNQCISNTWKFSIFIFPTGQIRVCEIRFASIGVICRNPYPVCKKRAYPDNYFSYFSMKTYVMGTHVIVFVRQVQLCFHGEINNYKYSLVKPWITEFSR